MTPKTIRPKKSKRFDDLRRQAEQLLREYPDKREDPREKDLKKLIQELQVHQAELEIQNEELRNAQAELEESRNRYFELYDLAPVGYFTLDRNGLVLEENLTGAELLRVPKSRLKNQLFLQFVLDEDKKIYFSHMKALLKSGRAHTCELRLVAKDDTIIYVRMESVPVRNRIGDVISIRSAVVDVTQRKKAELALKESEEKFRLIAETSPDVIFQIDPNGFILYCSPSAERIFGYTLAEVKGTPLGNYLTFSDVRKARTHFQRLLFGEKIESFELNLIAKDGTLVPIEINTVALDKAGKVEFFYGFARDVTERRKAEEALKENEEHLRLAVEGGNLGTWDRNLINGNTVWNKVLYDLLGRDPGRPITGETFFEYIHKNDLARVRKHLEKTYRDRTKFVDEFRIVREDGQVRWLAAFGRTYYDQTGRPFRIAGVNLDITERKNMEEELHKYRDELETMIRERTEQLSRTNQELLAEMARRERFEQELRDATNKIVSESNRRRFLSGKLVETLERDRRDVAMYLHDQIGQMLATLKMDLETLAKKTERADGPTNGKLKKVENKIVQIIHHVKDISRKLRPDVLDTLGLIPALRSLIEGFREEIGLEVHFHYSEPLQGIETDKTLALYRITQEALNNAGKHAQATQVFVNLVRKDNSIQLSVEDNGIGFDYGGMLKNTTIEGPLGIMIMRERAVLAGGELGVESKIGKGTHVMVEIPIE